MCESQKMSNKENNVEEGDSLEVTDPEKVKLKFNNSANKTWAVLY